MILKVVLYTSVIVSWAALPHLCLNYMYIVCVWKNDDKKIKQLLNFELHVARQKLQEIFCPK